MITQEYIDLLLEGRELIDLLNKYGRIPSIIIQFNNFLSINNFESIDSFMRFDFNMVLYTIDDCYRMRRKDNVNIPFICDGCVGRSVPCYFDNPICFDVTRVIPKQNESKIYEEVSTYALQNGIDLSNKPEHTAVRFLQCLTFDGNLPKNCNGMFYKIKEPEFEILWQDFSRISQIGINTQKRIDDANGE